MKLSCSIRKKIIKLTKLKTPRWIIAEKLKISATTLYGFLNIWKYHGDEAIKPDRKRRDNTFEFKKMIVEQICKGKSTWDLAGIYRIDKNLPGLWYKLCEKFGYNGLRNSRGERNMPKKSHIKTHLNESSSEKPDKSASKITTDNPNSQKSHKEPSKPRSNEEWEKYCKNLEEQVEFWKTKSAFSEELEKVLQEMSKKT
ncbi:helix-turn-helix domain-containing protein [[Mycoplasma] testudinis]|uniref:helix-turn-helix domain-containing protein n=1 Tax=[Mycoplasma] testudinis TaxID=33924 RepID=UPI0004896D7A|nr:helix-turn-helix domain-containing protein [[Mycoplasma] testudinis]